MLDSIEVYGGRPFDDLTNENFVGNRKNNKLLLYIRIFTKQQVKTGIEPKKLKLKGLHLILITAAFECTY